MKHSFLFLLTIILGGTLSAQQSTPSKNDSIPGTSLFYESRNDLLAAPDCNPSEGYLKKKVKAEVARQFENYPKIAVDFLSFKGQHGYNDKKNPDKIIYPYEIEMFVHIKRRLVSEGKEFTEYQTWKFERVYEYATLPGKKNCEFYHTHTSERLVSKELVKVQAIR